MADQGGDSDDRRALEQRPLFDGLQVELFVHHRIYPGVAVRSDRTDYIFEKLALEAFRRIDIADLLALDLGCGFNLFFLAPALREVKVADRPERSVRDCAHRDRFGHGRGEPRSDENVG